MQMASIKKIPKAELHVHIEGTITPKLALQLAAKNKKKPNFKISTDMNHYLSNGFEDFLHQYDNVAHCIAHADDYELITYDYLQRMAADNVIYVEFFGSKDHGDSCNIPYPDMVAAMARGAQKAEEEFGIVARCIMTCVRHFGLEKALPAAQALLEYPHPFVVGFGMAGDENAYHPQDFQEAFQLVQKAGYKTTAHAGEAAGAESIYAVINHLNVNRIGHGVRAIEEPELVAEIIRQDIHLEICPGSNISLGFYPNFQQHPFPLLYTAGCSVSLNSDDPPFFKTNMQNEYATAISEWNLDQRSLLDITRMAIKNAFCDHKTKETLLKRLENTT